MNNSLYILLKVAFPPILQSSMKGNDKQNKKLRIIIFKDYDVSVAVVVLRGDFFMGCLHYNKIIISICQLQN